ncbi:MAG: transposase [Spirochaetaceae bacterium]|jgi:REP element-mobilizing transposase RayT|nr:transposase [Spirochaetaceae bacterium]
MLQRAVWYEIHTRINNREPLFRRPKALSLFTQVFRETEKRFVFQVQGVSIADDRLTFYIKPADGEALPAIMKWMKQVFAQRYNRTHSREGHIWGDRYRSRILSGEPPTTCGGGLLEDPEVRDRGAGGARGIGVRPQSRETPSHPSFPPLVPLPTIPAPG